MRRWVRNGLLCAAALGLGVITGGLLVTGYASAWHTDPACVDGVFRVVYPNVPANTGVAHTPYGNIALGGSIPIPAGVNDVPVSFDNGEHAVEHRPTGCTPATTTTIRSTPSTTSPPTSSTTVSASTTLPAPTPSTVTPSTTPPPDSSTTSTPATSSPPSTGVTTAAPTTDGPQPGEMCSTGCLSTPAGSPPCGTQSPNATTDSTSPGAGCSSPSTQRSLPKTGTSAENTAFAAVAALAAGLTLTLIARRRKTS